MISYKLILLFCSFNRLFFCELRKALLTAVSEGLQTEPQLQLLQFATVIFINIDPRVSEIMQDVMKNLAKELEVFHQKCEQKMGNFFEACFVKTSVNPDKFSACLKQREDKLKKIVNPTENRLNNYFPKRANLCLTESRRSVPECTDQIRNSIRQMLLNVQKGVEILCCVYYFVIIKFKSKSFLFGYTLVAGQTATFLTSQTIIPRFVKSAKKIVFE